MSPCCSLCLLLCPKHSGSEGSRRGTKGMSECLLEMIAMIRKHKFPMFFFFLGGALALEEKHRIIAQGKRKFLHLSQTPANRNECPYQQHFWTSPANTSILSLSLKSPNLKVVTLIRTASQPVAMFLVLASGWHCARLVHCSHKHF